MEKACEPTNITFFVEDTNRDIKRFVQITSKEREIIQALCNAGFEPNVSIGKCPKIEKLLGWALLKNELELRCDWENIECSKIICLIYWREIDEEAFSSAKDYFEDKLGLREIRDKVLLERFESKYAAVRAPFLGGSEIIHNDGNELDDGRKVIAVVEGGEHNDLVNRRLEEIKQQIPC
jgi:hypothetical protein